MTKFTKIEVHIFKEQEQDSNFTKGFINTFINKKVFVDGEQIISKNKVIEFLKIFLKYYSVLLNLTF
jgi:hypothetical protein